MWRAAGFLSVCLATALAVGSPPVLARRPAGWTVLLYIHDDCRQENCGRIARIVEQFAQVGSSERVEVLAFVDQVETAPALMNQPGMAGGRLFRVDAGALALVATYPGEPNMGSATTLSWALSRALEYSARENLAVISIGHGSPWVGLTPDASSFDPLTFEEYAIGLQRVFDTWGRRPDVLALTHCGTACVEALFALASCARWILASEDLT